MHFIKFLSEVSVSFSVLMLCSHKEGNECKPHAICQTEETVLDGVLWRFPVDAARIMPSFKSAIMNG